MGKRRSRFKAQPRGVDRHGAVLNPQPLLDFLKPYRALPSHYLKAAVPNAADLITFASQEGLIRTPKQLPPLLGRKLAYELTQRERSKDWQFAHEYLVALTQYLFDIAPRYIPGLTKRTLEHITFHPNYPGGELPDTIEPDAPLFGYHYQPTDGYFYLYGFEADRGTEPLIGSSSRQTILDKVERYNAFFEDRVYKTELGISNCSAAFVTTSETRAHNIRDLIKAHGGDNAHRYLVTWLPDFLDGKFIDPSAHMLTTEWLTATGTLSILNTLKGVSRANRPQDARKNTRAA